MKSPLSKSKLLGQVLHARVSSGWARKLQHKARLASLSVAKRKALSQHAGNSAQPRQRPPQLLIDVAITSNLFPSWKPRNMNLSSRAGVEGTTFSQWEKPPYVIRSWVVSLWGMGLSMSA